MSAAHEFDNFANATKLNHQNRHYSNNTPNSTQQHDTLRRTTYVLAVSRIYAPHPLYAPLCLGQPSTQSFTVGHTLHTHLGHDQSLPNLRDALAVKSWCTYVMKGFLKRSGFSVKISVRRVNLCYEFQ